MKIEQTNTYTLDTINQAQYTKIRDGLYHIACDHLELVLDGKVKNKNWYEYSRLVWAGELATHPLAHLFEEFNVYDAVSGKCIRMAVS